MLKELKRTQKNGNHAIFIQDLVSPDFSKQLLSTRYTIVKNESNKPIQILPVKSKG
jgi:hypothetical protein